MNVSTELTPDRQAILDWFEHRSGHDPTNEIEVTEFIAAFGDRLSPGQGRGDLRWLVERGYLHKRVDYRDREANGHIRPIAFYSLGPRALED